MGLKACGWMLWALGGLRPAAWNRCPVQSCALSVSQEHGGARVNVERMVGICATAVPLGVHLDHPGLRGQLGEGEARVTVMWQVG